MSEFWIDLRRHVVDQAPTFIATGRATSAVGRPLSLTFQSYDDLQQDLESLGVKLTYMAHRQLSGGLHATIRCDERTLRLLGVWDSSAE